MYVKYSVGKVLAVPILKTEKLRTVNSTSCPIYFQDTTSNKTSVNKKILNGNIFISIFSQYT